MNQLLEFFSQLTDTSDWPPRWHCGRWSQFHGWLYIISDLMIWAAYFAIPLIIIRYITKRTSQHFKRLYVLFAAFILACGATHFLDALMFWVPAYRLSALVKFATGIISWVTVFSLIRILPQAVKTKTSKDLEEELRLKREEEQEARMLTEIQQEIIRNKNVEIKSAEILFRAIVENGSDAICLMDGDFNPFYRNARARALQQWLGIENDGDSWIKRIADEDRHVLEALQKNVLGRQQQSGELTFRVKNKEGAVAWLAATFTNMLDDAHVKAIVVSYRDVTEKRRHEADEALFRSIVNYSEDAIISRDKDGRILTWNHAAQQIFGYTPEEAIGSKLSPMKAGETGEEDGDILDRITGGEHIASYETERYRKNGSKVHVSVTTSAIVDKEGTVIGISEICRDITGRIETEGQLVKSERTYRTIAANLPKSVVTIVNRERRYLVVEGEGLGELDYDKAKMEGVIESEVLRGADYPIIRACKDRAFAGEMVTDEMTVNGVHLLVRYVPLRDEDHDVYAVMTITMDVTEMKNAMLEIKELNDTLERRVRDRTRQLEIANKELESFSYSVSHDLRAPLRIINGYSEILTHEYKSQMDGEGQRILQTIINNTLRMGTLIDELLRLSRLGRQQLVFRETDMNELIKAVMEEQIILPEKPVILRMGVLHKAECDAILMKQVWSNLLSNAIKYSSGRAESLIEINSEIREGAVVFSVSDNGVGFDMRYSDKLFGVFQRLHKKSEFEGTGIGLALVQRIVSRHDGDVWAEAVPDQGATFYFTLPLNNSHDRTTESRDIAG